MLLVLGQALSFEYPKCISWFLELVTFPIVFYILLSFLFLVFFRINLVLVASSKPIFLLLYIIYLGFGHRAEIFETVF